MSAKKVHHLMTTTASPGRKVSSPGKQPSPQARAAARRYATVLAGRIGMAVTRVAGLAARVGTHSNVDWPVVLAFAAASMVEGLLGGPLMKRAPASILTTAFGVLLLGVCVVTAYDLLSA